MENKIFYHADDYGVSISQSERIIACHEQGVLNSISIIPNSAKSQECFDKIKQEAENGKLRCVVHLNFIEGYPVSNAADVPDLVNEKGMLSCTFVSVLKMNYSHKRAEYKKQLKKEIAAQIDKVASMLGTKEINLDSHQHFHMIPIVWEAIMEVVKEQGYGLKYLRISLDPLSLLLTTPSVWKYLKPVNLVKWLLLAFLCPGKHRIKETGAVIPVFFGLFFTCEMRWEVVKVLLPKYQSYAQKRNKDLELMFHPGAVYEKEELLDASIEELKEFYASENREAEKETLMTI